jgi:hypothetical protein
MQNFARSAANRLTKNHSPGNARNAGQKTCQIPFSATSAEKNCKNYVTSVSPAETRSARLVDRDPTLANNNRKP